MSNAARPAPPTNGHFRRSWTSSKARSPHRNAPWSFPPHDVPCHGSRRGIRRCLMLRPRFILLSVVSVSRVSAVAAQSAAAPAQTIQVYSFGYTPTPIQLAAGREVTLSFVNQSGSGHDFTAPDFFAGARIVSGAAPNGEVELKPRETKTVTLIRRPAPTRRIARISCTRPWECTAGRRSLGWPISAATSRRLSNGSPPQARSPHRRSARRCCRSDRSHNRRQQHG